MPPALISSFHIMKYGRYQLHSRYRTIEWNVFIAIELSQGVFLFLRILSWRQHRWVFSDYYSRFSVFQLLLYRPPYLLTILSSLTLTSHYIDASHIVVIEAILYIDIAIRNIMPHYSPYIIRFRLNSTSHEYLIEKVRKATHHSMSDNFINFICLSSVLAWIICNYR